MLRSLLPKAHHKFLSLPLLGPIADGFDDWLSSQGYTRWSRGFAIRMLPRIDADLRRRHVCEVSSLTHEMFFRCWSNLDRAFPDRAGTAWRLEEYLIASGMIAAGQPDGPAVVSSASILSEEYAKFLREVRGFAAGTVSHHIYVSKCFLNHLDARKISLGAICRSDVEAYVSQAGKRLSRASLQHDIAAVRGLLRFLALDGQVPTGLDRQIDTPRLYRLEQLPRALPWDGVNTLLQSIDTTSAIGLRDYAMLLLIATYGLRASEVVTITLDDIDWRVGSLRIHQRKTSSPLQLPLTNEVSTAIVRHLKRTPPPKPHRRIFLRMRAPRGVLKPTAVTEVFQAVVRRSGLSVPVQGPHCLRHSLAVHLLKNGTPLKTIGDILGHRTAESTSMYLRLATNDLREVSLAIPGKSQPAKGVRS
jgi:site-specific recombinase XerD